MLIQILNYAGERIPCRFSILLFSECILYRMVNFLSNLFRIQLTIMSIQVMPKFNMAVCQRVELVTTERARTISITFVPVLINKLNMLLKFSQVLFINIFFHLR